MIQPVKNCESVSRNTPRRSNRRSTFFMSWKKPRTNYSPGFAPSGKAIEMNSTIRLFAFLWLITTAARMPAADYPATTEGDYTIRDFKFASGESLSELKIHYRTLGKIDRDASGKVTNAVFIMHGTTGS